MEIIDLDEMLRVVGLKHDEIVNFCPNCGKKDTSRAFEPCRCGFDLEHGRDAIYLKQHLDPKEYEIIRNIEHSSKIFNPFLITNHVKAENGYHPVISIKELHIVELGCGKFQEFPESIGNLTYLWNLNMGGSRYGLSDNKFLDTFGKLINLEWLNLEDCALSQFPDLRFLKKLKRLKMKHNKLPQIPDWIGELEELIQLHFRLNKISVIPESLGNLKHLKWLNLNDNEIEEIPKSIGELRSLEELEIRGNKLKNIPREIGNLTNLKRLIFSSNEIRALPHEIGNLSNLYSLNISSNPIQTLPDSIGKLKKLEYMDITWTKLKTLPESLIGLESLKEFIWRKDQFEIIPPVLKKLSKQGVEIFPSVMDDEDQRFERLNMNVQQIREFIDRIEDNVHKYGCNHSFDNFYRSLNEMGISKEIQRELYQMCIELSAFCDCEVLMNAAHSLLGKEPAIFYTIDDLNEDFF